MLRSFICLLFLFGLTTSVVAEEVGYQQVLVPFYTEQIKLTYDPAMLALSAPGGTQQEMVAYFYELSDTNYQPFLRSWQQASKALALNDWLTYQLLAEGLLTLQPEVKTRQLNLNIWFFLSQLGFDTRLAYTEQGDVFVFAHTEEVIFEAPVIEDKGRSFVNLTDVKGGRDLAQRALYLLDLLPNPGGRSFSWRLLKLPMLKTAPRKRSIRFWYEDQWEAVEVMADETVLAIMSDYPVISESGYVEVPFSDVLSASLLPQLRQRIEGLSDWEAVGLIASFTRSAFAYQEDKAHFGHSKPMTAEETFLYAYSDCEDRCAVFFNLVKELLGLPMVIVAYDNHLSMAVALPKNGGGAFSYEGTSYYLCDPTGPSESAIVGIPPQGYERSPFKIMAVGQ